jgi:hypothetical protein
LPGRLLHAHRALECVHLPRKDLVRYVVLTEEVVGLNKRGKHRKDRERGEPPRRPEMKDIFAGVSAAVALARFLRDWLSS